MIKCLVVLSAFTCAYCAFAEDDEALLEYTGGEITKPAKGLVVVVDAQNRVAHDEIEKSAAQFLSGFHLPNKTVRRERFVSGDAERLKAELKATAMVVVTDDVALPMSIVAPEASWAVANVAAVAIDAKDAAVVKSRIIKVMRRSLLLALGGTFSPDGKLLTAPVKNPADLDALSDSRVVMEQMFGVVAHAQKLGIADAKTMTYRDACEQGWAPQPTNKYQKAAWDDVHALPTQPIKILPPNQKK